MYDTALCCSVQRGGRCGCRRRIASNSTHCCSPLKRLPALRDICADAADSSAALLVADSANRCVKAVAASGRAALVFQCGADSRPRGLQLVRPATGDGAATLLLVECLEREQQVVDYSLAVAARSGERFAETRRLPLPLLSKHDPLAPVSVAQLSGGLVLIGNARATALEVVDARDASDVRRAAAPVALDFALWAFAVGTADAKELLAAIGLESHSARAAGGGVARPAGTAAARTCRRRRRELSARPSAAVREASAGRRVGRVAREPLGRVSLRFGRDAAADAASGAECRAGGVHRVLARCGRTRAAVRRESQAAAVTRVRRSLATTRDMRSLQNALVMYSRTYV